MTDQMELALKARDDALAQVWDNAPEDWRVLARRVVRTMNGQRVTGEDIRLRCAELDITPHHHNAWGALIAKLVRSGWLVPTRQWVPMKGAKSHGRQTQIYIVDAAMR